MSEVLADLGYGRNADSMRGFVVQAWLIGGLALVAAVAVVRWMLKPALPTQETADDPSLRGKPFMRHTLSTLLRLTLGIGIVVGGVKAVTVLTNPALQAMTFPAMGDTSVLAVSDDGKLHIGTSAGYFMVDRAQKSMISTGLEAHDLRGVAGLLVEGTKVWIASQQGLFVKDGTTVTPARQRDGSAIPTAFSLLRTRDGRLLAGGERCVWLLQADGQWDRLGEEAGVVLDRVSLLHEDGLGGVWAGSDTLGGGGLLRSDAGAANFSDASAGLPHRSVCDMQMDSAGVLWVATGFAAFGGAATWDEQARLWLPLKGPPGLEGAKIRSLFLDSTQALWFCSEYDGICIKRGEDWLPKKFRQGFPCREVKDTREADGGFWLVTERGLLFLSQHPLHSPEPR